jgi:oligoribonuclease NrnB/cAMP/cGMP phosphodiesterase (DHH superfamily)
MTLAATIQAAQEYLDPEDVDCLVFHHPCIDGSGAALSAWYARGDLIDYIPMEHQVTFASLPAEEVLRDKNVVLIDIAFKHEQLLRVRTIAKKVLILDHHDSAMKNLHGIPGCCFTMGSSGAMLAWHYFNGLDTPAPKLIELIEDRDLWRWQERELSEPLYYGLTERHPVPNFRKLAQYLDPGALADIIEHGKSLTLENLRWCEAQAENAKLCSFTPPGSTHTYQVMCIQLQSEKLISELAEYLYKHNQVDFVVLWHRTAAGKFKMSFRNNKVDINVADIATALGGGGHPRAAGALVDSSPWGLF